jgi:hypothetical protein
MVSFQHGWRSREGDESPHKPIVAGVAGGGARTYRGQHWPTHRQHCRPHRQIALVETGEKADLGPELDVNETSKWVPKTPRSMAESKA